MPTKDKIRVIVIDPIGQTVDEQFIDNELAALQSIVEGYIETAMYLDNNVVYVNEEGMFNSSLAFFGIDGGHQPFAGVGVIVGDKQGKDESCNLGLDEIRKKVRFYSRPEVAMLSRTEYTQW